MPFTCKPWHDHTSTEFEHQRYSDRSKGTFDIKLDVTLVRKFSLFSTSDKLSNSILTQAMAGNGESHKLATSNLNYLYWTPYQQVTHHTLAGCGLETGDLLGTGTITGEVR
jgi:fumarylacetoacetase